MPWCSRILPRSSRALRPKSRMRFAFICHFQVKSEKMNIDQLVAKATADRPKPPRFEPIPNQVYDARINSFRASIPGQFGMSTAVDLTMADGANETMWLSGVGANQFDEFMEGRADRLPLDVAFARIPKESINKRTYSSLVIAEK